MYVLDKQGNCLKMFLQIKKRAQMLVSRARKNLKEIKISSFYVGDHS